MKRVIRNWLYTYSIGSHELCIPLKSWKNYGWLWNHNPVCDKKAEEAIEKYDLEKSIKTSFQISSQPDS